MTASLSLLHDNSNLMRGMLQGLNDYKEMGIVPHKKGIPTGTLTRIDTNIMEQNKVSLKFFSHNYFHYFYWYLLYLCYIQTMCGQLHLLFGF